MSLRLRRLLPADLRGQVAGILFLGLALSQLMAALLYFVLLPGWQTELRPDVAATRIKMVVQLLEAVDPARRSELAQLCSDAGFRLQYEHAAQRPQGGFTTDPRYFALRGQIAAQLNKTSDQIQVQPGHATGSSDSVRVAVALRGGGALEVSTSVGLEHRLGLVAQVGLGAFLVFVTAGLWIWLTLMVNVPLTRVARAAERVGVDINAPPLAELGPAQLQRVIRAFNDMQLRLRRFLTDRTLMLGAISHDLRTPLTRLRLRVETDRAVTQQRKMLDDIESMEGMLTSTMLFIRGVDDAEPHDVVDLASLLQTACDMVSDLGGSVEYSGAQRARYHCKPQALLRAFTNVIMNAAKYGHRAHVGLTRVPGSGFVVDVEDEGAGISNAEKCRVFEPFYRSDHARELDSHGMGLGLSIARSVILGHGGTIELLDRKPRGLHVRIVLPEAAG
ncbi:MAG TPA: ATP-binding protein [Steroidobacteraceae bacterium]|jgi:signal transduction histidine kinase|nr:ATP-binding protein [Steroidobacteraceae bacterium]